MPRSLHWPKQRASDLLPYLMTQKAIVGTFTSVLIEMRGENECTMYIE